MYSIPPRSTFFLLLLIFFCLNLISGCGKRAQPEPPSLVIAAAVTDLHVEVRPAQRFLVWSLPEKNTDGSRPADLSGFYLYRKVSSPTATCLYCDEGFKKYKYIDISHPQAGYLTDNTFHYPLLPLSPGTVELYYIETMNSRGWHGSPSNKVRVDRIPYVQPPEKVECHPSLSVVEISWVSPYLENCSACRLQYRVYRRAPGNGKNWLLLTPEPLSENHYIDVGLDDWKPYEYSVTSLLIKSDQSFESAYSKPVKIIPGDYTPPSQVRYFTAFPYINGIQLVWSEVTDADLAGYEIRRRDLKTGLTTSWNIPPHANQFLDVNVSCGHRYKYEILSYDRSRRRNKSPVTAADIVVFKCN